MTPKMERPCIWSAKNNRSGPSESWSLAERFCTIFCFLKTFHPTGLLKNKFQVRGSLKVPSERIRKDGSVCDHPVYSHDDWLRNMTVSISSFDQIVFYGHLFQRCLLTS
ncbi:hypothetical protein M8J76_003061 [Diaphorina citri]|nr:hypothetical protein M8J76_003061 [Diaphorina citri]